MRQLDKGDVDHIDRFTRRAVQKADAQLPADRLQADECIAAAADHPHSSGLRRSHDIPQWKWPRELTSGTALWKHFHKAINPVVSPFRLLADDGALAHEQFEQLTTNCCFSRVAAIAWTTQGRGVLVETDVVVDE